MLNFIYFVIAFAGFGALSPASAAWSEFPKDDAAAIKLVTKETGSSLESAHLLFLYNQSEKKNVPPPSPEIASAYAKVRAFYDSDWSASLAAQLEPREFTQILLFSFSMRPPFEAAHRSEADYPLDFYKVLKKNSRALTSASGSQAAFWIALSPCLDGGSGELIASLMAQGMKSSPAAWIEGLAPAQALIQKAAQSKGGVCGDGLEDIQEASSVVALREVMELALNRKRDRAVFEGLKSQFKKQRSSQAILDSSGLARDSAEYRKLKTQIEEFERFLEKPAPAS
jgi:hypothetical protein